MEKAIISDADAVLYDIEDSVPLKERDNARTLINDAARAIAKIPRYVRINGIADAGKEEASADIEASTLSNIEGIVVPKVQGPEEIVWIENRLHTLESERNIKNEMEIIPMIESALGVHFAYDILNASQRIVSVILGTAEDGDLQTDLGTEWSPEGLELHYYRSHVLLAARAAGIEHPLDGVFPALDNEEGLLKDSQNARRLGYRGKTIIHPKQIAPVHQIFSPTEEERSYYREMIKVFEDAGQTATRYKGKMVDRAMVRKAKSFLSYFND